MVSRLFSTAGSFMSQVGEVLAPQVHTPLEDLRTHWKAIRKFYIDEKEDDVESFQASQLPEHLVSIGEILLDEEASLGDTGPCVEFFLQNKIVETLCALAERDSPRGVRKLVLQTLTMLIGDLSIPLLPHMSVHRPTRNLLRRLVLNNASPSPSRADPPPNYDSEFVGLLEVLAKKCTADPSLIGFFMDDLEYPEGSFLIFQGLLRHLWNAGTVGERARKGMITCLQLPDKSRRKSENKLADAVADIKLEDNKPVATEQPAQTPTTEGQAPQPTPENTTTPQPTTEQPQSAPTTPVKPQRPVVMINYETFVLQQVIDLFATFRGLPTLTASPSSQFSDFQVLENCKNRISFCSAVARVTQNDVGSLMIHYFEEKFLDSTLGPALLNPSEKEAISATIYLREILPNFSAPLVDILFKFLLGDFVGPEKREDEDVHLLRSTLINRINAPSDNLSISTCRLFSTMLGLHNYHVLYNLLLRSFSVSTSNAHSNIYATPVLSTNNVTDSEFEQLQPSIARYLTLFGTKYSSTPHITPTSPPMVQPSPQVQGENGYDVYLVDAQHQLVLFKAACQDWPSNYQAPTQPVAYVGSFIEQLLLRLGKSLDQPLDTNLVITGILSKLCYYPITPLSLYLLCHQPNVVQPNPTLYNTLEKLLEEIESRAKKFVNIGVCIDRARAMMAEENNNYDHSNGKIPNVELTFNPRLYLQAVIVLEEFCKELAATLQAKLVNAKVV